MATLYVGSGQTYTTIKAALDAAKDGDIIIVSAGNYTAEGEIQVNKGVTLAAASGAEVIVDHIVLGASYNQPAVDTVKISGLTITPTAHNSGDGHYTGVWQNNNNIKNIIVENCIIDFTNTPVTEKSVGIKCNRGLVGIEESLSITGCTVIAGENTSNATTIGVKKNIESINITGNTFEGSFTSSAAHMDLGHRTEGDLAINISGNTIDAESGYGIYVAGIVNENADITVSNNTVDAPTVGVRFAGSAITGGTADVAVTGNNITVGIKDDGTNSAIVGVTPAEGSNAVVLLEPATKIVVDDDITGENGAVVTIDGKNYIIGVNAFANITDAVTAAVNVGGNITVKAGNYTDNITAPGKTVDGLTITGETDNATGKSLVNWTGTFVKGKEGIWQNITISNINFINTTGSGAIISLQNAAYWTFENCSFDSTAHNGGFGWNPIEFATGGNINKGHVISNCTLTGGSFFCRLQEDSELGYALKVVDCTILNTNFNIKTPGTFVFEDNDVTIEYNDAAYAARSEKDNAFIVVKDDEVDSGNNDIHVDIDGGSISMVGNRTPLKDKGWSSIVVGKYFSGSIDLNGVDIKNETQNSFISNTSDYVSILSADLTGNTFIGAKTAAEIAAILNTKNGDVYIEFSDETTGKKGAIITQAGDKYVVTDTGVTKNGAAYAVTEIFVNAAYDAASAKAAGKIFGVNAFANFEDAIAAASAISSITRIEIESDITQSVVVNTENYYDISQKLTIAAAAGKEVTVYLPAEPSLRIKGDGASLKIEDGVKIDGFGVVADGFATSNEELIINGEVHALSLKVWTSNNGITVNETGKVVLGFGDGQLDWANGNGFLTVNGTLTGINDASLTAGPQFKAGYSGTRGNGNAMTLKNTYFEAGAWFNIAGKNGTFNVNNSVLKVSGGDAAGSLTISNSGNALKINSGRLEVNKLTVGANNTVTVSGSSMIKVANLASGIIDIANNTTLTDSNIGGAGVVSFKGVTTFEGTNNIAAAIDGSLENFDFVINEGASLTIGRYTLGYGRDITVKGTIEDATALTSLDGVTLSLKVNHANGFSIGGYGTSVLDVTNAYVDLGKSTWKNATGTYTWNFKNSYVKVGSFADNKAGASATASWVTTFDDSVLESASYLKSGKGMTVNFINGSVATIAGSMRIDGILNIDATSSVTVNGYFNNTVGVANEHSDILGTMNIAGTMNITTSSNDVIDLIGGTININEGGTFNLVKNNKIFVDENSTLAINGGTLISGEITNNGTVQISGETSVNLTVTGNGVQVLDGATITDSTIGGTVYIMGGATFAGTVSANTVNLYSNADSVLTIAEDAVLNMKNDICMRDYSTLNVYGTVNGNALSIAGTLNVDGGSLRAYIENYHDDVKAQINITNDGEVTLTNAYKDIFVDLDVTSMLTLTGTAYKNIFVEVADYAGSGVAFTKVVDVKNDKVQIDFTESLRGSENLMVIGNDLFYFNMDTIYVNTAWEDEDYVIGQEIEAGTGLYFGVNAFASLDGISDIMSQGARKVHFTYAGGAENVTGLKITVENESESGASLIYTFGGQVYASLGGSNVHEFAPKSGSTYIFDFKQGDFDFDFVEITKAQDESVADGTVNADGSISGTVGVDVNEFTGRQNIGFTVADDMEGAIELDITGLDGAAWVVLYDKDGNTVKEHVVIRDGKVTFGDLAKGDYKVAISAAGIPSEVKCNVAYNFTQEAVVPTDDTWDNATLFGAGTTAGTTVTGEFDSTDVIDWFKFTAADGVNAINFTGDGDFSVIAYTMNGDKLQQCAAFWVFDEKATGVDYTRYLNVAAGSEVYLRIEGYGKTVDYSVALA